MSPAVRVIVGISGGVDSAVAALRLLESGFEVQGLHMTNWQAHDAYCTAAADYQAARQVCTDLGITLHRASFEEQYRKLVFADFLAEYRAGRTPNPDVLCNRHIKFGAFLEHALRLGADKIATGHYARLEHGDGLHLRMSADRDKDQTYFLHAVDARALSHAMFPLADMTKSQVRVAASRAGLSNHGRPDSTGICFIGERPFRKFLGNYLTGCSGPILTPSDKLMGQHDGLMFYTIGQRSGVGIGGLRDGSAEPWYVASKDVARNALIVVQGRQHPLLWARGLVTERVAWIGRAPPAMGDGTRYRCHVRIRHRHGPASAAVQSLANGGLLVCFDEPQWAVAPGQSAVLYRDDECLGGAVISRAVSIQSPEADAAALAGYPL